MHVGPFGDEIGEHLRLYRLAAPEINGVCAELYRPFNDAAIGFLIIEDVAQRILSNHCYLICLKVMAELPRCNKDSVQQLLDLRIPSLRLILDFANEVDKALNFICVPGFFSFNDDGSTDDMVGCSDVDK